MKSACCVLAGVPPVRSVLNIMVSRYGIDVENHYDADEETFALMTFGHFKSDDTGSGP